MTSLLSRLLGRKSAGGKTAGGKVLHSKAVGRRAGMTATPPDPRPHLLPLTPEFAFIAIGDVHGQDALLAALLDRLGAEAPGLPHLFLGDVIDRGPASAQVLARLLARRDDVLCLRGNHETMMLDFLDDPDARGPIWLNNGGAQTLTSFGITAPGPQSPPAQLRATAAALTDALGPDLLGWLRGWPLWWGTNNIVCAHAGCDPIRHPADQPDRAMIWGDPAFLTTARNDDFWIVHGHWITPDPRPAQSRIPVDTGAYATGILTAAVIETGQMRYVSVTA